MAVISCPFFPSPIPQTREVMLIILVASNTLPLLEAALLSSFLMASHLTCMIRAVGEVSQGGLIDPDCAEADFLCIAHIAGQCLSILLLYFSMRFSLAACLKRRHSAQLGTGPHFE